MSRFLVALDHTIRSIAHGHPEKLTPSPAARRPPPRDTDSKDSRP